MHWSDTNSIHIFKLIMARASAKFNFQFIPELLKKSSKLSS